MAATKRKTTKKTSAKKAPAKKTVSKTVTPKKTGVKKATATKKKTTVKRVTAKKTTTPKKAATTRKAPVKSRTAAVKKKAPVKKVAAKKVAPKKTPSKAAKLSVGAKPFTKTQFVGAISEQTGLTRKEITSVLDVISDVIALHLRKNGPSAFSWPGIMKMKVVKKPATKARKGINPFTGEPTVFKAKPASRKVKILPLKQLKEMATS